VGGEECGDQASGESRADGLVQDHALEQQRADQLRDPLVQVEAPDLLVAHGFAQHSAHGLALAGDEAGVERGELGVACGARQQRGHERGELLARDLLGQRAQQRLELEGQVPVRTGVGMGGMSSANAAATISVLVGQCR
jgi:hypothetical protein